jgi:hypothetical protein
MDQRFLIPIGCIAVLAVILCLGLWPFHAPKNDVIWLKDRNGLTFGDYGTVMSTETFRPTGARGLGACTVEISLEPAITDYGGTILSFYTRNQLPGLSLHQSLSDLVVQSGNGKQRTYIADILYRGRPVFVTVTSGAHGAHIYINGILSKSLARFQISPSACTGLLILGDGPWQQDTWSGQIRGLAIYYDELSADALLQHYWAWIRKGQPEIAQNVDTAGLYVFDERAGNVVHNLAHPGANLNIPDTYVVLDQILLEPFWDEFNLSWGYWKNVLKNIVGFIPLGFCFYGYFSLVFRFKRARLITVILGAVVSLMIELLQAYLPTRQSGTTDLMTNTLGTYLGILSYRSLSVSGLRLSGILAQVGRTECLGRGGVRGRHQTGPVGPKGILGLPQK